MTPAQCRAARGLIDWSQVKLAEVAAVAVSTVTSFEQSSRVATPKEFKPWAPRKGWLSSLHQSPVVFAVPSASFFIARPAVAVPRPLSPHSPAQLR